MPAAVPYDESQVPGDYVESLQRYHAPDKLNLDARDIPGYPGADSEKFWLEGMQTWTLFVTPNNAVAATSLIFLHFFAEDDVTQLSPLPGVQIGPLAGVPSVAGATAYIDVGVGTTTLSGRVFRAHYLMIFNSGAGGVPNITARIFARS